MDLTEPLTLDNDAELRDLDVNTACELGWLRVMAGIRQGTRGPVVNPKADGPKTQAFVERVELRPIDPQSGDPRTNGPGRPHRAQVLVQVLEQCGDDLTRANVLHQAASPDFDLGLLRPDIRVTTSPTDYQPVKPLYLVRFNGRDWVPVLDAAR